MEGTPGADGTDVAGTGTCGGEVNNMMLQHKCAYIIYFYMINCRFYCMHCFESY